MKRKYLIIAVTLFIATLGAYGSSHHLRVNPAYYVHGDICCVFEEVDCPIGNPTCFRETPHGIKLMFASQTPAAGLPCSLPLEEE